VNTSLYYTDLFEKSCTFRRDEKEIIITFDPNVADHLFALDREGILKVDGMNINVGFTRLRIAAGYDYSEAIDALKALPGITGIMPAMIEEKRAGSVTRYFLPGRFIVQIKDEYINQAEKIIAKYCLTPLIEHNKGYYSVSIPRSIDLAEEESLFKALRDFKSKPEVEYVEPDEGAFRAALAH
jgi:hypothetical protein